MALTRDQSLQLYGTEAYTGWGEAEAAADASAKGFGGNSVSGITGLAQSFISQYEGDVDKYVQDLIDFAGEDYNFAAKWIEDNYTQARGQGDQRRADFLKKVANSLEEKVGRIEFDYDTQVYRNRQDKDIALDRLAKDESQLIEEEKTYQDESRRAQEAELNQRGILSSTREQAQGLAGREVGDLETNLQRRMDALNRLVVEKRQDIELGGERNLENITTSARRSAIDVDRERQYSLERAEEERKRREREAQLEGQQLKKTMYGSYKDYL